MTPRERVFAALNHRQTDRVPRFEVWIDAFVKELGDGDLATAYVRAGQDGVILPSRSPAGSNAWRDGVDEWGRVWKAGMYAGGVVATDADLRRYTTPAGYADMLFDADRIAQVRARYPDHCLFYGTHAGPFTAAYMAMGFESFFVRLRDDPSFVHRLLANRTVWCIALFQRAIDLGAELLVLGDDAAHRSGPMISPRAWRDHVLPYHRRIVEALSVPTIWHSDGDVTSLLPMAIEAGFAGVHGLEPAAGIDLAQVKRQHGRDLVLIGNVDVGVLSSADLDAVRREVSRCVAQGASQDALRGGFMISTCNSIFAGMNLDAVIELFRCEREVGFYP
jgi:uroporphyrinogen decarboxylase